MPRIESRDDFLQCFDNCIGNRPNYRHVAHVDMRPCLDDAHKVRFSSVQANQRRGPPYPYRLIKLLVFTPARTPGFFDSIGFPCFMAYPFIAGVIGLGLAHDQLGRIGRAADHGRGDRVARREWFHLLEYGWRLGISGVLVVRSGGAGYGR